MMHINEDTDDHQVFSVQLGFKFEVKPDSVIKTIRIEETDDAKE